MIVLISTAGIVLQQVCFVTCCLSSEFNSPVCHSSRDNRGQCIPLCCPEAVFHHFLLYQLGITAVIDCTPVLQMLWPFKSLLGFWVMRWGGLTRSFNQKCANTSTDMSICLSICRLQRRLDCADLGRVAATAVRSHRTSPLSEAGQICCSSEEHLSLPRNSTLKVWKVGEMMDNLWWAFDQRVRSIKSLFQAAVVQKQKCFSPV